MTPNKVSQLGGVLFNFVHAPVSLESCQRSSHLVLKFEYVRGSNLQRAVQSHTLHILLPASVFVPQIHYIAQAPAPPAQQVHFSAIRRNIRMIFCYGRGRHEFGGR
jgi:hypothetical protein